MAERAGGKKLVDAYRHYLYRPLGLEATWLAWHEPAKGTLPTGYMGPVAAWKHSEMFGELGSTAILDRSPVEYGAGGLIATARDSLIFLRALLGGKLVSPASLAAMMPYQPMEPPGLRAPGEKRPAGQYRYGLGLIEIVQGGHRLLGHGGLFTGHSAGLWQLPECGVTYALYLNRGFVDFELLLDEILAELESNGLCRPERR